MGLIGLWTTSNSVYRNKPGETPICRTRKNDAARVTKDSIFRKQNDRNRVFELAESK